MRRAMRHAELLGAREPRMCKLVPALDARDGAGLPGTAARGVADHRDAEARGDALPQDAGARPRDPRRGEQVAQEGRHVRRRDRVHALRHLRLSARPDAGRAASRAASASTFRRSPTRWSSRKQKARASWAGSGEAATEAIWFPLREKLGATEFLGYDTEVARGRRHRAGPRRQGDRRAESRRERAGGAEPDAVLRRVRRSGRRHRHAECRRRPRARDRHEQERRRPVRAHRHGGAGRAEGRLGARARCRSRAPQRDPRQPFGDASAARGAAPGARRSRRAEGLAGRAGPAALRLLASQADDRGGDREGRGHRQRLRAAELAPSPRA